jgi:hypothetical protein
MADNWIERRFKREHNLDKAEDLWQAVSTAIHDACNSYNAHYANIVGQANFIPQNGHGILVEVTHEENKRNPMDTKRRVRVTFDGRRISVTVDEHTARVCDIEADEAGCFIKSNTGKLSPDEFSSLALRDALFTPRNPNTPESPAPKFGVWS